MEIVIKELDASNVHQVNQCDGTFLVDSVMRLHVDDRTITYSITSIPSYRKRYPKDDIDYASYINHPEKHIFLASIDDQPAGQIIVRKNWNRFAYIQDIAVDIRFRKIGVGRKLMARAMDWARTKNLAGVMLETQNNNVGACKFYERLGFQLAGFDQALYRGIDPNTNEIALYWYLVF